MHLLIKDNNYNGNKIELILSKNDGLKLSPRVGLGEDEMKINSLLLVNQSFIEKVLKRKIKHKLDHYINYIILLLNDEDDDNNASPDKLSIVLNDVARYKSIIEYKYRKYLDEKYINLLLKKINLLEHELKMKMVNYNDRSYEEIEEKEIGRRTR